jgi:hypothetical protein
MKRKSETKSAARLGDILQATSIEQRAWLGAVALAYNDAEAGLHRVAGACFDYPGPNYSVTSRINGTDGLVAIIGGAVTAMGLPDPTKKLFSKTLAEEGFAFLKGLRDGAVHAELFDSGTGLGSAPGKRGKSRQDVLLTPPALEGLYRRLASVTRELGELETIIQCEKADRIWHKFAAHDQRREQNGQDIRDAIARCQSHQNQRRSLPPFPKFPNPPDVHQLIADWVKNPHATKSISLQAMDD